MTTADDRKKKQTDRLESLLCSGTPNLERVRHGLEDMKTAFDKLSLERPFETYDQRRFFAQYDRHARETIIALASHVIELDRRLDIIEGRLPEPDDDEQAPELPPE